MFLAGIPSGQLGQHTTVELAMAFFPEGPSKVSCVVLCTPGSRVRKKPSFQHPPSCPLKIKHSFIDCNVFHISCDLAHTYHVMALVLSPKHHLCIQDNRCRGFIPFSVPEVFRAWFLLAQALTEICIKMDFYRCNV